MEILDVIIFVQSFVWATLLLKQSPQRKNWLGLAFFTICFIYILHYLHIVLETNISEKIIYVGTALTFLLLSFYKASELFRYMPRIMVIIYWILITLFAGILILSFAGIMQKILGICFILFGLGSIVFDGYIFANQLKNKLYTNSAFRDSQIRLSFFILLSKFVAIIYAFILMSIKHTEEQTILITNSFHFIICILIFIGGFIAVTSLFEKTQQQRKKNLTNTKDNSELIIQINKLMNEQKVYLDCEFSLGKMADLLQSNEHELTTVLNRKMETNFYKLINDYRIEMVKQKLQEHDSRNFTIMASAYESGFNSKSTFYRIFKEYTNMTPKEYITKNNNR